MSVADDPLEAAVADRLARAARAAQDLCDVLWEVLHGELSDRGRNGPRAQRVADLSERVTEISSTVALLARDAALEETLREEPSPAVEPLAPSAPVVASEPSAAARPAAAPGPAAMSSAASLRPRAVIVDERAEEESELVATVEQSAAVTQSSAVERPADEQPVGDPRIWPALAREQTPAVSEQPPRGRPLPWDEPPREEMRVTRRAVDRPSADKPPV
jgi:hypothetical protein